jgi:hypothetical protein
VTAEIENITYLERTPRKAVERLEARLESCEVEHDGHPLVQRRRVAAVAAAEDFTAEPRMNARPGIAPRIGASIRAKAPNDEFVNVVSSRNQFCVDAIADR